MVFIIRSCFDFYTFPTFYLCIASRKINTSVKTGSVVSLNNLSTINLMKNIWTLPLILWIYLICTNTTKIRALGSWEALLRPAIRVVVGVKEGKLLGYGKPGSKLAGFVHHLLAVSPFNDSMFLNPPFQNASNLWFVCVGFLLYFDVSHKTILLFPCLEINKLIREKPLK